MPLLRAHATPPILGLNLESSHKQQTAWVPLVSIHFMVLDPCHASGCKTMCHRLPAKSVGDQMIYNLSTYIIVSSMPWDAQ